MVPVTGVDCDDPRQKMIRRQPAHDDSKTTGSL